MNIAVYIYRLFFMVVFMSLENGIEGTISATFHCQNLGAIGRQVGHYISEDEFCDNNQDCDSNEDEGVGCNTKICGEGKFFCDQGECKNVTVRCDTIKDCKDGTDELNCGDEINVKNCTREDQFLCRDGRRCLSLDYTCNNECNCFDCSDENDNCTKNDYDLMHRCPHAYFVTAHGPQCLCSPNTNTSSSTLCNRIENCYDDSDFNGRVVDCHQRCIRFGIKVQCSCFKAYHAGKKIKNHLDCSSNETVLLLYSNSVEIRSMNIDTHKVSSVVRGITNCTILTAANNYVYYVTSQNGTATIFKASFHTGKSEKLIEMNFTISSIAVDYITNNIYFTSNGSLMVCTNDGQICKQIKCCGVGFVTLNPQRGFMFYTLQTQRNDEEFAVMRSNLDGSEETTLTDNVYRGKVSITVEESINALFLLHQDQDVVEKKQTFHKISIKSVDRVSDVSWFHTSRILSFSPDENGIFFLSPNWNVVTYVKMNQYRYSGIHWHQVGGVDPDNFKELKELHVYSEAIQHSDENPCNKSACSGLCLLKPEMHSANHFLSFTCVCDRFTPKDGNHWCGNEIAPEVHHGIFWIVTSILVVTILVVVAACYIVKKKSWYFYYLTLREWMQGEQDQRIILKN